jgi:site-specific DNA recombinase
MRYILYCRKSSESEERQILSIEQQLAELREFAAKENLEIVASLCEAQTAKEPGRTKFAEMLSLLEEGKADGILSWHPDRLARNSVDGGRIVYALDTGAIKALKFPTFWFENTPQGKFFLNIAFGQSKYYSDNLGENIKRGHRAKLRKGIWPGFAPLGYLNDYGRKDIKRDDERTPLVQKMFELYASGKYTLKQIAKITKDLGLRTRKGNVLGISCVQRILKSSFYYGLFTYNGEVHEGTHEPLISKKLFEECQEVMKNRGHRKTRKAKTLFPFRGLLLCGECGCSITSEIQKGHIYYRCTKKKTPCTQKYIREEEVERQIISFLQKVSLSSQDTQEVLGELQKDEQKARLSAQSLAKLLREDLSALAAKLDKLLSAYLDEVINSDEYTFQKQKFLTQKVELKEKINEIEQKGASWLEPAREWVKSLNEAEKLLSGRDKPAMTAFLSRIGSNHTLHSASLGFCRAKPYEMLAERRAAARREASSVLPNSNVR